MYLTQMQNLENDEIITVIDKAALFGGLIYQQGTFQLETCSIRKIEILDGKLHMEIMGASKLDGAHPLCINFAYRNFTFRVPALQFSIEGSTIICHIPLEAKAISTRPGGERHVLPFDSNVTALLHRIEKRDSNTSSLVKIVDVSKWGMGAYFLGSDIDVIQYDHLWIKEINQVKLASPIFTRAEYINARKYKDDVTVLKVGLSIEKLPEEIYLDLIKNCHLILSA